MGLAFGSFGQGAVDFNNSSASGGVAHGTAGTYTYDGPYGVELWMLNGNTVPANINSLDGVNSSQAYANLTADGFVLETKTSGTISAGFEGIISGLGNVKMADVNRATAGGNAVLAVAFWEGNAASFGGASFAGVMAFVNPTSDYTAQPTPTAPGLTGWDTAPGAPGTPGKDLVTTAVPEPGTFALAGLGAAALFIFRRRK